MRVNNFLNQNSNQSQLLNNFSDASIIYSHRQSKQGFHEMLKFQKIRHGHDQVELPGPGDEGKYGKIQKDI